MDDGTDTTTGGKVSKAQECALETPTAGTTFTYAGAPHRITAVDAEEVTTERTDTGWACHWARGAVEIVLADPEHYR